MTIPMTIPFGRRRLVFSLSLSIARPPVTRSQAAAAAKRGEASQFAAAFDATDIELAKLNGLAAAEADRPRWQAQAIFHGFRG